MKQTKKLSFYELNPRYFKDNSGNGVGDLEGLAAKFDYFNYLNIDAIILQDALSVDGSDKFPSFKKISRDIGDVNGIIKIITLAKKYRKKILIELKLGSMSEANDWFKAAQDNQVNNYTKLINFNPKVIDNLPGVQYKYSDQIKQYYPIDVLTKEVNLNWKSEYVIKNFIDVIRFWSDLGIQGFVFKEFEYIADDDQTHMMSDATLKELRKFYRSIKEINDDIIVVGKTHLIPFEDGSNYTSGTTKVFDYFMSTQISEIDLDHKFKGDVVGKFVPRKLSKVLKTYAQDPANILSFDSKYFGRTQSRWGDDLQYLSESAKTFALLLLMNKCSTSIYYGQEIATPNIGLTHLDDFQDQDLQARKAQAFKAKISEKEFMNAQVLQNSINARALMAWNSEKNGGFSLSEKTITPISTTYKEINVANQFQDQYSPLQFFKKLNRIVKESSYARIIKYGDQSVSSLVPGVIKITFELDTKEIIVYANLTKSVRPIKKHKEGRVAFSTYGGKVYSELPKRLEPFESIFISKRTDEYIKETQAIKIQDEKIRQKAEHIKTKNLQAKAQEAAKEKMQQEEKAKHDQKMAEQKAQAQAVKLENAKLAQEKEQTKELKMQEKESLKKIKEALRAKKMQEKEKAREIKTGEKEATKMDKSLIDAEKMRAMEELSVENSHKSEATILKEEDIAKTTIIDDEFDLDDLFGDEKGK